MPSRPVASLVLGAALTAFVAGACSSKHRVDDGSGGSGGVDDTSGTSTSSAKTSSSSSGATTSGAGGTTFSSSSTSGAGGGCDGEGCACTTVGATQACWTGPPQDRNQGACKDGTQTCVQAGEFGKWGPCTGEVLDCNPCMDGQLTWSFGFDGWPKTYQPQLGPKDKIVSLISASGIGCWDQNGNCIPCPGDGFGQLAPDGKSYYLPFMDLDNDNSGMCTYVFKTQICK